MVSLLLFCRVFILRDRGVAIQIRWSLLLLFCIAELRGRNVRFCYKSGGRYCCCFVLQSCEVAMLGFAQNIIYEVASECSHKDRTLSPLSHSPSPPELEHSMLRIAMQMKGELGCVQVLVGVGGVGRSD